MSALVSFLIPTINPLPWLNKALSSIMETASDYSQVEVLLRVDSENSARIDDLPELERRFGVKSIIMPREPGWMLLVPMVEAATGLWSWNFDDDAYVEGQWQKHLQTVPCDSDRGPVCQPEFYCLGQSVYKHPYGPPTMIVPTAWALRHKIYADSSWHAQVEQDKWRIQTLAGVRYYHDGRPRI